MKIEIKPWNLTEEEFKELEHLAGDTQIFTGTNEEFWQDHKEDE